MKAAEGERLEVLVDELGRADQKARKRGRPEDWHKLRTTSRRLRGALIAHAPGLDVHLHAWLARRAKKITKLPTEVRDLDVALENLGELRARAESKPERRAARELMRRLEEKRRRSARRTRRRLERDEPVAALASVLRKAIRRRSGATDPALAPAPESLEACAAVVLERHGAVRGWQDDVKLHDLRVAVKKYRGALAALVDVGPARPEQQAALEVLQRVQQVLGEHHDWSELSRRLAKRARKIGQSRKRSGRRKDGERSLAEKAAHLALRARARHEQRERYELYARELAGQLPEVVRAHAAAQEWTPPRNGASRAATSSGDRSPRGSA